MPAQALHLADRSNSAPIGEALVVQPAKLVVQKSRYITEVAGSYLDYGNLERHLYVVEMAAIERCPGRGVFYCHRGVSFLHIFLAQW